MTAPETLQGGNVVQHPSAPPATSPAHSAQSFIDHWFEYAELQIELRSFTNVNGEGPPKIVFTRDAETIETFRAKWDVAGRGTFFGCATRALGVTSGSRPNCRELPGVWLDVDTVKMGIRKGEVSAALTSWAHPPSIVVNSGGGVHAYWKFPEALDIEVVDGEDERRAVAVMKQLAGVFAGDHKVCEVARVLRLPGTHNTKAEYGEPQPVSVVELNDNEYELGDLEETLAMARPLIELPEQHRPAAAVEPDDPWAAFAKQGIGYTAPIDVRQMLDEMTLGGDGNTSVHQTQLLVSASMVSKGHEDDEIVELLMTRTQEVAGHLMNSWNWAAEEKAIRGMIKSAREKFGASPSQPAPPPRAAPQPAAPPQAANTAPPASPVASTPTPSSFSPLRIDGSFAPAEIAQRAWIVRYFVMRSFITLLVAKGGVGKTTLGVLISVAVALGLPIIPGFRKVTAANVLMIVGEEDLAEMGRRLAGVLTHYDINPADLGGKLYIESQFGDPGLLVHYDARTGMAQPTQLMRDVHRFAVDNDIGLIIVDPLVMAHNVPENENTGMGAVVSVGACLARETNAALLLVHHSKKAAPGEGVGDMDSARGASSLPYAARVVATLDWMTAKDAEELGIDKSLRKSYRRLDDAKRNYGPPDERTNWLEMRPVEIANGEVVPVPIAVDLANRAEREQEAKAADRIQRKLALVAETVMQREPEGRLSQKTAAAILAAAEGRSIAWANDQLAILSVSPSSDRVVIDDDQVEIWRVNVGGARTTYDICWTSTPLSKGVVQ